MIAAALSALSFLWGRAKPALVLLRANWKPALYVLVVMVFACGWFLAVHEHHRAQVAERALADLRKQEAAAAKRAKAVVKAQATVSAKAEANETAAQAKIRTVTQTIIKEVPLYVSPQTDARFPLPVGLVRLYDRSLGLDVPGVPNAPGQSDGEASPVPASVAGNVFASNGGECLADRERLTALQDWTLNQQAAAVTP